MRILFLSPWCPYPADNGSKLRIYHLLRGLGQRHAVDLLSFCPEQATVDQEAHLRNVCHDVQLLHATPFAGRRLDRLIGLFSTTPRSMVGNFSEPMAALVRQRLRTQPYDLVIAAEIHMAPYAALAPRHIPAILEDLELGVITGQVAAATHPIRRLRLRLMWWKMQRYISVLLRRFVGVTVVSEAERALISQYAARIPESARPTIELVPNGVDLTGYAASFGSPEPDTLVYPGALSYDANFDAVAHFIKDIQPLIRQAQPTTRLRVTGRTQPAQLAALPHDESVEFTGYLDDVRPTIARAWAEVVPLRKGGGTRLKVLEALALGTPVISTPKGVEGLNLVPGRDVLVAETPESFAAQTVQLLRSPALRRELADHGRRAAAPYDWSYSVDRLEHLLEQTATRG